MARRTIDIKLPSLIVTVLALLASGCEDSSGDPEMAETAVQVPGTGESFELSDITWTNSNSPDAVLFWHFLDSLYVDIVEPNGARSRLLSPGLTPKSDEEWLAQYFVERYLLIDREVRQAKREVLSCDDSLRDPPGSNGLIDMINGLHHVEISVYDKQLAISSVQLAAGRHFDVTKAIRNSPSGFQRTFRKVSANEDFDVDENQTALIVESMCKSLLHEFNYEVGSVSN